MHNSYTVRAIGTAHSPYTQKFGIPRQPQLAPAAQTCIVLDKQFGADCVRGLDGFEYIWVQFLFHDAVAEGWAELVRPPERKRACLPAAVRTARTTSAYRSCGSPA